MAKSLSIIVYFIEKKIIDFWIPTVIFQTTVCTYTTTPTNYYYNKKLSDDFSPLGKTPPGLSSVQR